MASMGTLSSHLKVSLSSRTELRIPYFSWGVRKGSSLRAENRHFSLSNGAGEEGLEVSPLQGELVQQKKKQPKEEKKRNKEEWCHLKKKETVFQNLSQIVERREAVSSIKLKAVSTVQQELIDINSSSSMCIEATGAKPSEIPFLDASGKEPDNRFLNGRAVAGDLGLLKQTNLDSTSVAASQDSGLQVSEKYETIEEQLEDLVELTASSLSFVNVVAPEEDSKPSLPLAGVNVMNVLLAAAECGPWSKTGGLGDVAGALPKALARRGHRVMVVVPKYGDYPVSQKIQECAKGIRLMDRIWKYPITMPTLMG